MTGWTFNFQFSDKKCSKFKGMQQTNVVNDYVVNPYTLTIFGIRLSSEHGKRQSFGHMACFVEGELLIKR